MPLFRRRLKFSRADTCVLCARTPAGEPAAVWDPADRDTLCVRCDPGWSVPTGTVTVAEPLAGAAER